MKYLIIFIAVLVVIIIGTLIIGGVFFTAAVSEAEPAVPEPEMKVTTIYDVPMPEEHQQIVREYCKMFNLDERLVYGVIFAESNFNNGAVNEKTGCFGYMQLNPDSYDPKLFSPPSCNLYAGISLLAELSKEFEDPVTVLLAYNNGRTGARRLINRGVTGTAYTEKALTFAEQLTSTARLYEEV